MKKLTLDIEALNVSSFETGAESGRGTVQGHSYTVLYGCAAQSVVTLCGTCAGNIGCPPSNAANENN